MVVLEGGLGTRWVTSLRLAVLGDGMIFGELLGGFWTFGRVCNGCFLQVMRPWSWDCWSGDLFVVGSGLSTQSG